MCEQQGLKIQQIKLCLCPILLVKILKLFEREKCKCKRFEEGCKSTWLWQILLSFRFLRQSFQTGTEHLEQLFYLRKADSLSRQAPSTRFVEHRRREQKSTWENQTVFPGGHRAHFCCTEIHLKTWKHRWWKLWQCFQTHKQTPSTLFNTVRSCAAEKSTWEKNTAFA